MLTAPCSPTVQDSFILGVTKPSEVDRGYMTRMCPQMIPDFPQLWARTTAMSIISMLASNGDAWNFFTLEEYNEYITVGSTGPDHHLEKIIIDKLVEVGYLTKLHPNGYTPTAKLVEFALNLDSSQ